MFDDKCKRKMDREEGACSHPARAKILALDEQNGQRSLAANDLIKRPGGR